jgi:hypothetical protein
MEYCISSAEERMFNLPTRRTMPVFCFVFFVLHYTHHHCAVVCSGSCRSTRTLLSATTISQLRPARSPTPGVSRIAPPRVVPRRYSPTCNSLSRDRMKRLLQHAVVVDDGRGRWAWAVGALYWGGFWADNMARRDRSCLHVACQ